MLLWRMCSSNLQAMHVREIGLWLEASALSPFLNTGITQACFQSAGKMHWSREAWNIRVKDGASSAACSFRRRDGISSGPAAEWALRLLSSFLTPSTRIVIGGRSGKGLVGRLGMVEVSSWVNTEEN